jgi:hypothetical protein
MLAPPSYAIRRRKGYGGTGPDVEGVIGPG